MGRVHRSAIRREKPSGEREERVSGRAQGDVMVESPPGASLEVSSPISSLSSC